MSVRLPPMWPGFDSRTGLSLLLVLVLAPRVFLRVLRFPSLHKNQHCKFQFDLETMDKEPLLGICHCKFLFIFYFYLFFVCNDNTSISSD